MKNEYEGEEGMGVVRATAAERRARAVLRREEVVAEA